MDKQMSTSCGTKRTVSQLGNGKVHGAAVKASTYAYSDAIERRSRQSIGRRLSLLSLSNISYISKAIHIGSLAFRGRHQNFYGWHEARDIGLLFEQRVVDTHKDRSSAIERCMPRTKTHHSLGNSTTDQNSLKDSKIQNSLKD